MELSLGLFFLSISSLATAPVECRNLRGQNGEPSSSPVYPSLKRRHIVSRTDRPENRTDKQDLPYIFGNRFRYQQITLFLEREKESGCGCQKHIRRTTSESGAIAEAITVPTTALPMATEQTTSYEEANTIINDDIPTTTESKLKYNTTCTDSECLTVVSSPSKADVTLRYRCMPPRKCGSQTKLPSNNVSTEEKVNEDGGGGGGYGGGGGGGGYGGGGGGGSTQGTGNMHGSSSQSSASQQAQSSSGYSSPGRHTQSYIIGGDHTYSLPSHITTGDHTSSSNNQINKGHGLKKPHTSIPSDGSSNDSRPTDSTLEPENAGSATASHAGTMGGGHGDTANGAKPPYGAFAASAVIGSNPKQTTQKTIAATTGPPSKKHNSFPENIPSPPSCGVYNSTLFIRIKGGTPNTAAGKWPWMVAYGYANEGYEEVTWMCAGSLISAKSSITAAHCLDHPSMKLRLARFGDVDLDDDDEGANPVTAEVDHGLKHPLYNKLEFIHDIGIVVLKRPLTFTSTIWPICLPFGEGMRKEEFNGMEPYIAGWGNLEFQAGDNSMLYDAQVPIVSNAECAKAYTERLNRDIRRSNICAGGNGTDACQGDSGGPLMVPWEQHFYTIGIVSWGFRCGTIGYPGVYTRITSYLDWLQANIT